jgi:hypothetical protein
MRSLHRSFDVAAAATLAPNRSGMAATDARTKMLFVEGFEAWLHLPGRAMRHHERHVDAVENAA